MSLFKTLIIIAFALFVSVMVLQILKEFEDAAMGKWDRELIIERVGNRDQISYGEQYFVQGLLNKDKGFYRSALKIYSITTTIISILIFFLTVNLLWNKRNISICSSCDYWSIIPKKGHCHKCGATMLSNCGHCGKPFKMNANNCTYCGEKMRAQGEL